MAKAELSRQADCWHGRFHAMASPCEVLMEVEQETLARQVLDAVAEEAWRIEQKFSRYREDNLIYQINHAAGSAVELDAEMARLLSFADQLYDMSDGLFDVTSGVLRKIWKFDGSDNVPTQQAIDAVRKNIGWQKTQLTQSQYILPAGMEIDLGGIGKEYAVDRCVQIAREQTDKSVLINFGGDLCVTSPRADDAYWSVGRLITGKQEAVGFFELRKGAIATSGDANRYLLKDGVRYSHVLNPETGWPIEHAPHTVSVAAATCTEAGMLSTLAMLQGQMAVEFLVAQHVRYWVD
jgi:thiamine biosynthesis lipoprotein